MKIKTSELEEGAQLDWAVAKCMGHTEIITDFGSYIRIKTEPMGTLTFCPSSDWSQGGPIIEREKINLEEFENNWTATKYAPKNTTHNGCSAVAKAPLEAAMRCYVASKLGDTVEIPEELL